MKLLIALLWPTNCTDQAFNLQGYKAELGKPYNRITFYLCSSSDYYDHSFRGFADTISDDGDDKNDSEKDSEDLSEPTQTKITKYTDTGIAKTTTTVKSDVAIPDVAHSALPFLLLVESDVEE